ncbi:hypothetical protein BJX64DRAFT_254301 [Aspergillus heterothallicus]
MSCGANRIITTFKTPAHIHLRYLLFFQFIQHNPSSACSRCPLLIGSVLALHSIIVLKLAVPLVLQELFILSFLSIHYLIVFSSFTLLLSPSYTACAKRRSALQSVCCSALSARWIFWSQLSLDNEPARFTCFRSWFWIITIASERLFKKK